MILFTLLFLCRCSISYFGPFFIVFGSFRPDISYRKESFLLLNEHSHLAPPRRIHTSQPGCRVDGRVYEEPRPHNSCFQCESIISERTSRVLDTHHFHQHWRQTRMYYLPWLTQNRGHYPAIMVVGLCQLGFPLVLPRCGYCRPFQHSFIWQASIHNHSTCLAYSSQQIH